MLCRVTAHEYLLLNHTRSGIIISRMEFAIIHLDTMLALHPCPQSRFALHWSTILANLETTVPNNLRLGSQMGQTGIDFEEMTLQTGFSYKPILKG